MTRLNDNQFLGTADYVAPEQVTDSSNVDGRADLYCLGCVFYFMLTARPPFPTGKVFERALNHRTKDPQPITEIRPDVPPGLTRDLAQADA